MKNLRVAAVVVLGSMAGGASAATTGMIDDVRLFQNFFQDSVAIEAKQIEVGLAILDDDNFSGSSLAVQGDMPFDENIDMGASMGLLSVEPDSGSSSTGLSDLDLGVRLHWDTATPKTDFSVGATLSLPIGDDDVGGGNTDVGGFVALRHRGSDRLVLTGMAGLVSTEFSGDRELSLQLGAGTIYHYSGPLHLVSELVLETKVDYLALSFGADYSTHSDGHICGAVLFGMNDGVADLGITGSYLIRF